MLVMHENKVAHRDIKGANILFTIDEKFKYSDFGLSTIFSNINPVDVFEISGTLRYLP